GLGGQRLWVVTLAPQAAFAPAWQPVALALMAGMLLVLLAAILIAYRQAGKLSRPLEWLAENSKRIGRLDFVPPAGMATDIAEVAQLASAQAEMTDTLRRYHERLAAQAGELRESEQHFRNVANNGSMLIWTSGADKLCDYFNEPWLRFTGRTLEQELGHGWIEGVHPDDRRRCLDTYVAAFEQRERFTMEYRLRAADGSYRWLHDDGVPQYDSRGAFIGYIGYCLDITERMQSEAALRESEHKYRQLFESANDGIVIFDGQHLVDCNDKTAAMFGLGRQQLFGLTPADLAPEYQPDGRRSDEVAGQVMAAALAGQVRTIQWQARHHDGSLFFIEVTVNRVELDGIPHVQAILRDITERIQAEEQIRNLAYFDPLTNLPNRRLFMDRLGQALLASSRNHSYGALLILDLDNFKALNDTRGHDAGDLLLVEVAGSILACVRQDDTVARLGGDEYVVMLEGLDRDESGAARQAEMVGEKIRIALNHPFAAINHGYHVSTSIGLTLFRGHDVSPEGLLKQADVALYQAKDAGKNVIRFFNPDMQAEIDARLELEAALRRGIENAELRLHYQPQFDQHGGLIGVEALLRWQPPGQPLVLPGSFIDLAEETGLILPIGAWVLESACLQLKQWQEAPACRDITIAVNVSASQFRQPDFARHVADVLASTGVAPGRLKLELTESVVMDQTEAVIARMETIRALGVGFAMDDFGTGYSSLSYLKRLPLDQLKIDRSFIRDVPGDPNDTAIVLAILAMSETLGLHVIAEGVETTEQRDFLQRNGCTAYQGYLYARPMPAEDFNVLAAGLRPRG
ncbi:MAG: EAL domain-containing protein, partial [Thiobacillus sp.]|nr:EAL domain-containing protein [Thiobacillus sp.]